MPRPLAAALLKPVTLVVSGQPLRQVFDALAAATGMNFVLEREVAADTRVSLSLREVSLDEALRVLQATQQLERKVLNDHTWMIYPGTQAKQREHQELLVRHFYLTHADVKQAQVLVRNLLKTRDLHVDERLNLLVLRDTPEVVAIAEHLIESLDQPEPEVVLELELLEMARDRVAALGLSWPTELRWGSTGDPARPLTRSDGRLLRAQVLNPALVARLNGMAADTTLLARPSLRARNREKARLQIGERLPVFSHVVDAASGLTAAVSYQDVGLKLELQPDVLPDDEVLVKLGVQLDQPLGQVSAGPGISAYRVGARSVSTTLRLRDGQTQLLAGLISDEDRQVFSGIPRLAEMPLLGRMFGVHADTLRPTELLLLITPHVLRKPSRPVAAFQGMASGNELNPGAASLRLRQQARVAVPMAGAEVVTAGVDVRSPHAASGGPVLDKNAALLELATPVEVNAGETASVVLHNHSAATLRGVLEFDVALFEFPDRATAGPSGRIAFELSPEGQRSMVLRALPTAGGNTTTIRLADLQAIATAGAGLKVVVQGEGIVDISSP